MVATRSPPYAAVALISGAILAYEILLMALFSLIQWHHFAYMVVSVALLGFGASGTFLVFTRHWLEARFRSVAIIQACLFSIASLACYLVAQQLSFNPEELLWDSSHWIRLELIFLLLALPFFFRRKSHRTGFDHIQAPIVTRICSRPDRRRDRRRGDNRAFVPGVTFHCPSDYRIFRIRSSGYGLVRMRGCRAKRHRRPVGRGPGSLRDASILD